MKSLKEFILESYFDAREEAEKINKDNFAEYLDFTNIEPYLYYDRELQYRCKNEKDIQKLKTDHAFVYWQKNLEEIGFKDSGKRRKSIDLKVPYLFHELNAHYNFEILYFEDENKGYQILFEKDKVIFRYLYDVLRNSLGNEPALIVPEDIWKDVFGSYKKSLEDYNNSHKEKPYTYDEDIRKLRTKKS